MEKENGHALHDAVDQETGSQLLLVIWKEKTSVGINFKGKNIDKGANKGLFRIFKDSVFIVCIIISRLTNVAISVS